MRTHAPRGHKHDKYGRIGKAHDCYHLLRSHFELGESGIAWRRGQAAKGGAVSSMYFHWASYHEETNGLRPKGPVGPTLRENGIFFVFFSTYQRRNMFSSLKKDNLIG